MSSKFLYSTECYTGNGANYMGTLDHASDGNKCVQWHWGHHQNFIEYNDDGDYVEDYYWAFDDLYYAYYNDDDPSTTEPHNYCR